MVDAVRLLPRLWDGQRLLRFLAGLAMLALAFAAHAGLTGPDALTGPAALPATAAAPAVIAPVDDPAAEPAPVTAGDSAVAAVSDDLGWLGASAAVIAALVAAGVIVAARGPLGAVRPVDLPGFGTRGPPLR